MRRPPTQSRSKQSHAYDPSPINISYNKEDLPSNIFQMPDLNPNPKEAKVTSLAQASDFFNNKLGAQFKPQANTKAIGSLDGTKSRDQSATRAFKKPPHRSTYEQYDSEDIKDPISKNSIPASIQITRKKIQRESFEPSTQKVTSSKVSAISSDNQKISNGYTAENVSLIQIQRPVSVLLKNSGNESHKATFGQSVGNEYRTPTREENRRKYGIGSTNKITALKMNLHAYRVKKSFDIDASMQIEATPTLPQTENQIKIRSNSVDNSALVHREFQNATTPNAEIKQIVQESKNIKQAVQNNLTRSPLVNRKTQVLKDAMATNYASITAKLRQSRVPSYDANIRHSEILQKPRIMPILERKRLSADQVVEGGNLSVLENKKQESSRFAYSIRSRAGSNHTGQRKTNQDSYIAVTHLGGDRYDRHLFGVYDGHGANGHLVSGFVKEQLPILLLNDRNLNRNPTSAFINSYDICHKKLMMNEIDAKFSGTTSISILILGDKIISANAGDSRAVMARLNKGVWEALPLSVDHKPDLPGESQRILKAGGRIEPLRDFDGGFIGPSRVWLMNQDIPGLAMSRSIGDVVAASVGVTSHPEIKEFSLTPDDKFIIIASDGVWEFLSNEEVLNLISPFYEQGNIEGACGTVLSTSLKRWQKGFVEKSAQNAISLFSI